MVRLAVRRHPRVVLLAVALVAVWDACVVARATSHGILVTPDSAAYFGTADNIRDGRGPTMPFGSVVDRVSVVDAVRTLGNAPSAHFPPGYPIALAVTGTVAENAKSSARLLGVLCVGVNLALVGLLSARLSGYRSVIVAVLPPLMLLYVADAPLFFEAPGWLRAHEAGWSEPLFVVGFTASLLVASVAIESTGRARRFAFVGVTALLGATLLTRYVGAAAILAVVASVALLDRSKLSQRMRRASVVGLAAVSPLGVFLAWQASAGAGPRPFAFHREPGKVRAILRGLGHSLFPIGWSDSAVTAAVAVVAVLLILALVMHRKRPAPNDPDAGGWTLMWLVVASVLAYLVVAVISQTLFDRALRFDARFFTGIRALWTTAVVVAVFQIGSALARPWLVAATLLVAAGFLVHADWPIQRNWLRPTPRSRPSAIERRLGRLPRGALIVSDAPDIVYLTSRRPSLALPDREVYLTGARNPTFDREVDDFSQILRRRGGYAFFARGLNPTLSAPELGRHVSMKLVAKARDEALFEIVPGSSKRPRHSVRSAARSAAGAQPEGTG